MAWRRVVKNFQDIIRVETVKLKMRRHEKVSDRVATCVVRWLPETEAVAIIVCV